MAGVKGSSDTGGFNPDISELEIIEIALDYLKSGKVYLKPSTLALVVIKKTIKPEGHIAKTEYESGFLKICSKVIRKLKLSGVIEYWSKSVYIRTDKVYTINPMDVYTTPLIISSKGKKNATTIADIMKLGKKLS